MGRITLLCVEDAAEVRDAWVRNLEVFAEPTM